MRKKIAKKIRKECLNMGCVIVDEGAILTRQEAKEIKEPRGYSVEALYNRWNYHCIGYDMLDAYHLLKDCIKEEIN